MGRLDRVIRHCKLREEAEAPSELKPKPPASRSKKKAASVPVGDCGSARPSWDQRAVNSRPEQYGATNRIDDYSAHELLFSLRGLSCILEDIARCDDVSADNVQDLLYVAGRIGLLTVKLEERIRTRNVSEYGDKRYRKGVV